MNQNINVTKCIYLNLFRLDKNGKNAPTYLLRVKKYDSHMHITWFQN